MIEKKKKWKLADFDYPLPEKYIAQYPAKRRDQSKLMVIHKDTGDIEHRTFSNLPEYMKKNDLLMIDNQRLMHGRNKIMKNEIREILNIQTLVSNI